jgi:transposase
MNMIGIDMSKNTFHAAFDDSIVKIFENTENGIIKFVEELIEFNFTKENTVIGVESTGVYHLLLCERLRITNWNIKVINPLITHRLIDSSLRHVKTDKRDAMVIRKALFGNVGYIYTDTPDTLALKTLVKERESLNRIRAETKVRIGTHKIREKAASIKMKDSFGGMIKLLSFEITEIEKEMGKYATQTQKLLRSIPGIGKVSSATLVAYVGDINRFPDAEKLTAYIGLDCRVHQSGISIHGKGYISKRGNSYLRHILFNSAFIASQKNPELKRFFLKKKSEGKHHFSALCAVERKLIHLIYAVWKRGTPFES